MKYRAKYLACKFGDKDLNGHRGFNRESMEKYLKDPKTQEKIKKKKLVGAISHLWRDKFQEYLNESSEPSVGDQSDYLIANNVACNFITNMEIKDNALYIEIETMPTESGLVLAKLFDSGYDMEVSMSTMLDIINDEYHIVEILGLDMTNSPAFNTKLISKVKEE